MLPKMKDFAEWVLSGATVLTHLSRINFPISIDRTSLFQILGVLGGISHF